MRVVDATAESFEEAGLGHNSGYAGGHRWPLLDALIDYRQLEGIQAKCESHAVHMADTYNRSTGRISLILATKGPGLLNATGALGERVEHSDDFEPALKRALANGQPCIIDIAVDLSVPTFFAEGVDRAYPEEWAAGYPQHATLRISSAADRNAGRT